MNLKELQKIIHQNAVEHGWWDSERQLPEILALIHSEVSEVLEEYRSNKGYAEVYYTGNNKPEGIPIELADIMIRVLDVAEHYGIDMEKVILEKHEYNLKRPYKHGKKV